MRFASLRIAEEYEAKINPFLRGLLEDAQDFAASLFQWNLFVTCLLRTPEENDKLYGGKGTHLTGVHVDGRGADIRTRDVDPEHVYGLAGYLNERYTYDPDRPLLHVALFEDGISRGSGAHLHLQCHPHTRNRHFSEEN